METLFYTSKPLRRAWINRIFATVYASAIIALLCHHIISILNSKTLPSLYLSLLFLTADFISAFMWCTTQSFRLYPIKRTELIEEMKKVVQESSYPALDVFICTADPYKEPPMSVVNTALSVMAYDYPTEKISVYVSDDGGSQLTLFAFIEAAKFAKHWMPFCKKNLLVDRSPEAFFTSNDMMYPGADSIKVLYESMKVKVENLLLKGKVEADDDIEDEADRDAFQKWTEDFTRRDHPAIISKLLDKDKDRDITGHMLPSLTYVSREKRSNVTHHFKAGALNALLRVSAVMTNAPIVLTLDCDMYSNDPITVQRALCYFLTQDIKATLGYVQFPQRYHGINKNDIYAGEHKHLFRLNPLGMDGLLGPSYVGTGCFFSRRALFGSPSSLFTFPDIPSPGPCALTSVEPKCTLELAHRVARCSYEKGTAWGSQMGFRYGSLVEDFHTGYRLQSDGWKTVFCDPPRAAFLGDVPITLNDVLNQNKRWAIGTLEVTLSKYSPLSFGLRHIGLLMSLGYLYYGFWAFLSIPGVTYSLLPQLALLNNVSIFPKVTDPLFLLYCFIFLGANGQDLIEFILEGSTFQQWWSDQRCWIIRGVTCYPFALIEFAMKYSGLSFHGFNLTNKVTDGELGKRYDRGLFEFGVHSPMLLTMTMVALLNLASFFYGVFMVLTGAFIDANSLAAQLLIAGYLVVNYWPVYEGILFRADTGKMPIRTTVLSILLSYGLYRVTSLCIN